MKINKNDGFSSEHKCMWWFTEWRSIRVFSRSSIILLYSKFHFVSTFSFVWFDHFVLSICRFLLFSTFYTPSRVILHHIWLIQNCRESGSVIHYSHFLFPFSTTSGISISCCLPSTSFCFTCDLCNLARFSSSFFFFQIYAFFVCDSDTMR